MPGWMRFVQAFVPVFCTVLVYTMWTGGRPPLWLVGLVFVLLLLGITLVLRVMQAVIARADTLDDNRRL